LETVGEACLSGVSGLYGQSMVGVPGGELKAQRRLVALQRQQPAYAQVGIDPLYRLKGRKVLNGQPGLLFPVLARQTIAAVPQVGDMGEAFDLVVQGDFQLSSEAARLKVDPFVHTLLMVLLQLAPEHQAGQAQSQEEKAQCQAHGPGGRCAHDGLRRLCHGDSTAPAMTQRRARIACHCAGLTGITDRRLPRCSSASSASAVCCRRRASGRTWVNASTNSTSSALHGFFPALALGSW